MVQDSPLGFTKDEGPTMGGVYGRWPAIVEKPLTLLTLRK